MAPTKTKRRASNDTHTSLINDLPGTDRARRHGDGLEDQYTVEVYYRLQIFQHATITPDVQYLVNPALNPEEDNIGVFGLRARVVF